jgi:hypothetical protein
MGIAVGLHLGIGKTGFNPTQPNSIEIIQAVDIQQSGQASGWTNQTRHPKLQRGSLAANGKTML